MENSEIGQIIFNCIIIIGIIYIPYWYVNKDEISL